MAGRVFHRLGIWNGVGFTPGRDRRRRASNLTAAVRPPKSRQSHDLSYVRKDQAETSVLFELIAARYERRSMLITANQAFGTWDAIFPDPAMTVAAIDRLVHHAIILEINTESYRRREAAARTVQPPPKSQ